MRYPKHLMLLIENLKRLPGVGGKTAERYAFQMLDWKREHLHEIAHAIINFADKIAFCDECGCVRHEERCEFCTPERLNEGVIYVVSSPREVYAIEATHEYYGLYHVLGGLLSPMDGIGPDKLKIEKLIKRIESPEIVEVVIGLDATLEGDATALYLQKELAKCEKKISRLAFGLPMGSSLDYIDGNTLARAFSGRNPV